MTPTPRKVRSGRRQFGPSPGSEQEWAKVMESPHVKRAFQDPAIQQALMQHMQQQAALSAPPPEAAPPGMAEGGPLHFDTGGANNATEIHDLERQIADLPEGEKKNNLRMRLATLQAQQSASPLALPGGGATSSSTASGLNQLVKPPTMGNTAGAMAMGALQGLGATSHQGMAALVGAGLSGALSYLVRKYGKNAQKPGQQGGGGGDGGGGGGSYTGGTTDSNGVTEVPTAQAWNPNWRNQQSAPSVTIPSSGPTGGPQSVPGLDNVGALPSPPPGAASETASWSPQSGRMMMGTGNSDSGNVISWDGGKTWKDAKTKKDYTDPVLNKTQIDPTSSLNSATPVTTPPNMADAPQLQNPNMGYGWDPEMGFSGGMGFAEGGPVDEAPPSGLASVMPHKVPVLHTTIVIAAKPKKAEKKQAGGAIRPLKPQALPPLHGPQDHGPRPHGRVQVPRGSGAAIKGKRFGGIY
jgi:hypothetical protein